MSNENLSKFLLHIKCNSKCLELFLLLKLKASNLEYWVFFGSLSAVKSVVFLADFLLVYSYYFVQREYVLVFMSYKMQFNIAALAPGDAIKSKKTFVKRKYKK